jgi:hypothetical protein
MEANEEWKLIKNYENYEVSSLGNIRNIKTKRILKSTNQGGYLIVGLCKNGKGQTIGIHRLVAIAFIENPENKTQVNHKDKNRSNNNVSNLEWNTALENNIHRSENCIQTTNQNIVLWRVDKDTGELLQKYNSIELAAKWCVENNLCKKIVNAQSGLSFAFRGLYKNSYGYKWKKEEQDSLKEEVWKNVYINNEVYQNYFVSNLGRFKNSKGIIMNNYKPHHSGYIYLRVNIQKYALHRLIASTFIENIDNKPFVNHIDGNKLNNCVENLEWVTVKENNQHSHNIGLVKLFKRPIIQYDLQMNKIKRFNSIKEATDHLKIETIKKVLYGKQKTAGGFIFKYAEEL